MTSPVQYAKEALKILVRDATTMNKIERYFRGDHDMPYMPDSAEAEYKLLAKRGVTNWMPLLVDTPAQGLYVDNFRRGGKSTVDASEDSPEWQSWQRSLLAARQNAVYVEALKFGHSFVLSELNDGGEVIHKGLSARRTVALYEDPATDIDPVAACYVKKWAKGKEKGTLLVWDGDSRYELSYEKGKDPSLVDSRLHGADQCPVTPFSAFKDLEGRTWGVVEPCFAVQDRINQTIFDLLVAQTYNSFEVRTVTGMAPPMRMRYNEELGVAEPVLDDNGNPMPDRVYLNASRFMYAADPNAKFSSLPGGSLDGFIKSAELGIRHLSALSQTPPHFLLGQIANISAEALEAAETALSRKIDGFRNSFGESWERVFRITSALLGAGNADDFSGEVIWRDLGASSLAQSADALGKFAESLEIPKRGLWSRVPGVSRVELAEWARLREEDDVDGRLIRDVVGMTTTIQPTTPTRFAQEATPDGNARAA